MGREVKDIVPQDGLGQFFLASICAILYPN